MAVLHFNEVTLIEVSLDGVGPVGFVRAYVDGYAFTPNAADFDDYRLFDEGKPIVYDTLEELQEMISEYYDSRIEAGALDMFEIPCDDEESIDADFGFSEDLAWNL